MPRDLAAVPAASPEASAEEFIGSRQIFDNRSRPGASRGVTGGNPPSVAAEFVRSGPHDHPEACDGVAEVKCKEVLDQLSDYVDDEARAELCRAIEEHLARCGGCKVVVDTVRKTILLYHNDGPAEIPMRVSAALESALAVEYRRTRTETRSD